MTSMEIFVTILVMTIATMITRFLPFLLFHSKENTPKFVLFLGEVLPYAVMAMLVVYCLKNTSFQHLSNWLPQLISVLLIIIIHNWKNNTLLSIASGTVLYMFLVQFIF